MKSEFVVKKIAEGKTKIIWAVPDSDEVLIENKDIITAGDGAKKDSIISKGACSTTTTVNVFKLLERNRINTHFIEQSGTNTFFAKKLEMIPIEVVARRIAFGSYLKRNPEVEEGKRFEVPVVEFFLKDDSRHDPYMRWDGVRKSFFLFDPKQPIGDTNYIDEISLDDVFPKSIMHNIGEMHKTRVLFEVAENAERAFMVAENAWQKLDVTLVDFKVEFGLYNHRQFYIGDVIDNDSWRIWPNADKTKMVDKEVYRQGGNLEDISKNYKWVAEQTKKF